MERHCATALRVARWLSEHRAVPRVWYPGLPSHPDHELAKRQMSGFGGMVTFTLGTKERAFVFWDRLRLVARAASLGGTESLSSLPILFSHTGYSAQELARAGVERGPRPGGGGGRGAPPGRRAAARGVRPLAALAQRDGPGEPVQGVRHPAAPQPRRPVRSGRRAVRRAAQRASSAPVEGPARR